MTVATFDRRNPVTGAIASTAAAFTVPDAMAAADKAALALTAWSALGPNARRAALN
jgi:benzaldehyde dehydrogenase (NAD)